MNEKKRIQTMFCKIQVKKQFSFSLVFKQLLFPQGGRKNE